MNKRILVEALVKNGLTARDAGAAIDSPVKTITRELKQNQKFTPTGFGTFAISKRGLRSVMPISGPAGRVQRVPPDTRRIR